MAIAFASEGNVKSNSAASLVVPMPSGVANGDMLLLGISMTNPNVNITAPTGYTLIGDYTTGTTVNDIRRTLYWKNASGEGASQTVNFDSATVCEGFLWRITGADSASPINVVGSQAGTGTTITAPSVTTTLPNTLLCFLGLSGSVSATTASTPAGFTSREDPTTSSETWQNASKALAGAGASGSASSTTNGAAGDIVLGVMLAIAPAVSASPPLIGHQNYDRSPIGRLGDKKLSYVGSQSGPLSDDAPGPAPVCNIIDCPTVDKRFSQVVFQGIWMGPVRDDNAPDFRHPYPWYDLPCAKLRRGYDYSGWFAWAPPIEYDTAAQWTEPVSPLHYKQVRDYTGKTSRGVFENAAPPAFGTISFDLPNRRPLSYQQLTALYMGQQSQTIMGVVGTNFNRTQFMPLMGVGNEGYQVTFIPPPGPQAFFDTMMFATYAKRKDYSGWTMPAAVGDVFPPFLTAAYTELPVRGRNKNSYQGYQRFQCFEEMRAPFYLTDLPVRGRDKNSYQGMQAAPLSVSIEMPPQPWTALPYLRKGQIKTRNK